MIRLQISHEPCFLRGKVPGKHRWVGCAGNPRVDFTDSNFKHPVLFDNVKVEAAGSHTSQAFLPRGSERRFLPGFRRTGTGDELRKRFGGPRIPAEFRSDPGLS